MKKNVAKKTSSVVLNNDQNKVIFADMHSRIEVNLYPGSNPGLSLTFLMQQQGKYGWSATLSGVLKS